MWLVVTTVRQHESDQHNTLPTIASCLLIYQTTLPYTFVYHEYNGWTPSQTFLLISVVCVRIQNSWISYIGVGMHHLPLGHFRDIVSVHTYKISGKNSPSARFSWCSYVRKTKAQGVRLVATFITSFLIWWLVKHPVPYSFIFWL